MYIPLNNRLKVARRCPRCLYSAYHFVANDTDENGDLLPIKPGRNNINCANCGHTWAGRITQEEVT